jgi:DNA-binding MarR family transcriptional regulator
MILSHGAPVTMGELSQLMDVPLSTATRMVDWLVATHFVARQHDPEDRRIVHVSLTEAGQNMLRVHGNYMRKRIERLLRHFNSDERQNLLMLMRKLLKALDEESQMNGTGERSFE